MRKNDANFGSESLFDILLESAGMKSCFQNVSENWGKHDPRGLVRMVFFFSGIFLG